jgi:hypothetical protein
MSFSIPFAAEGTRYHSLYSIIPACWGAQQKISMAPHKRLHFFTCNPPTMSHRREDLNPAIMFGPVSLVLVSPQTPSRPIDEGNRTVGPDGVAWPNLDAARFGPGLNELRQTLYTLPTTSMFIVRGGKIAGPMDTSLR